ncbi:MAG: hypothetical protein IPN71_02195 [Fibrobacteres bacterium]|nr:hypothetical protein [Fibrobacterota bacterium]
MNRSVFPSLALAAICFSGCATCTMSKESFLAQTKGATMDNGRFMDVKDPWGGVERKWVNRIGQIHCEDSKNQAVVLLNAPSIEIRFSKTQGGSVVLYFDSVFRSDSLVFGSRSRLIDGVMDTLYARDIAKIEIQDGRKKFSYVSP